LKAAHRVLQYILQTKNFGIIIKKNNNVEELFNIKIFCDASHGDNVNFKSTLGVILFVSESAIFWSSRKAKVVSLCTMESEYYSLSEAVMESTFIKKLLFELTGITITPTIYCDNTSCISLAKTDRFHSRAKHISIKYQFIKEYLTLGYFVLQWIPSSKNLADILTKPVLGNQYEILVNSLLIKI
jgi:hypothetical protein